MLALAPIAGGPRLPLVLLPSLYLSSSQAGSRLLLYPRTSGPSQECSGSGGREASGQGAERPEKAFREFLGHAPGDQREGKGFTEAEATRHSWPFSGPWHLSPRPSLEPSQWGWRDWSFRELLVKWGKEKRGTELTNTPEAVGLVLPSQRPSKHQAHGTC